MSTKQDERQRKRYRSPEISVIEIGGEDIVTTSGHVQEGVGIQWSWTFENTYGEPFGN